MDEERTIFMSIAAVVPAGQKISRIWRGLWYGLIRPIYTARDVENKKERRHRGFGQEV